MFFTSRCSRYAMIAVVLALSCPAFAQSSDLRAAIESAVAQVRPALVRIHVVEAYYQEGREMKYEASGSGAVITPEGHVITNHHVAGHAKRMMCTFSDKTEVEAILVGTDPLTDIAVLKLVNDTGKVFPVARFGDSKAVQVGDSILAMGCPLSLSQSVTLGIVSNTEMIQPQWMQKWGGFELDGEDVGALVKWIGHDAAIYPGNSGGPLVNMAGEIIGINELDMGLSGAIPGNLAQDVSSQIIANGQVKRAWLGVDTQPRLKHDDSEKGVLIGGVLKESPAMQAGIQAGDLIVRVGETPVDVQFMEQLPDFNQLVAHLAIGAPVEIGLVRAGAEMTVSVTPVQREPYEPDQVELKEWGLTVRDISYLMAKELKRTNTDGVLVTSVRPGGPAGAAKPVIEEKDILVAVGETPIHSMRELKETTEKLVQGAAEPVPTLVRFERKTDQFITVVKVGIKELSDPGREVKKAWLPVETQVLTTDIAELLGAPEMTGFRVTHVYKGSTAEKAGLQVGDLILAVEEEPLTASAPEQYEELPALIRQYRVGDTAALSIKRGADSMKIPVELVRAPLLEREMKKYEDEDFEYTARDVTFFDKATEQWSDEQRGVLVSEVKPGGWAALGGLKVGDLLQEISGQTVNAVEETQKQMETLLSAKPKAVVFKVLRGIHTLFIEMEPKWDTD